MMEIIPCLVYSLLSVFIQSIEIFLKTGRELLVYFMTDLRAWYTPLLLSRNITNISKASVSGTILGAIDEVRVCKIALVAICSTNDKDLEGSEAVRP